jgi:CHRD domain-containing protein
MHGSKAFAAAALLVGAMALASCASSSSGSSSNVASLGATLNGASEVPPNSSTGTGNAVLKLDKATKTLSWTISYSGLTGDAGAAHFHGPAAAGANAGVVAPVATGSVPSPAVGSKVLTDEQIADLMAGKWYVNIHTKANPGGEIRGQITPTM